jgi:DNA-binding helix-hairpin-helix protein with protein kinase domain
MSIATMWPGPADINEQSLRLGPELGSGGQGRVLRVEGYDPPLVFKQYLVAGADPYALKALVDLPTALQPSEREQWYARAAWPLARVFNRGQLSGFIMQHIPRQFSGASFTGSMKLREVQYLVYPRRHAWGTIVPEGGVSARTRLEIAHAFARLLAMLHGKSLVVGDVSVRNMLWAGTGSETEIFLIDCDGIRMLGSRPVLPQRDTLDWNDPLQPKIGPDLDSDRYKLALLVGRVLTVGKDIHPDASLQMVPGIPDQVAARVSALWQRAAGPRFTRPDADEWVMALSNREEIILPPTPPVRQLPSLPQAALDGDLRMSRPGITLPHGGTSPEPKATDD